MQSYGNYKRAKMKYQLKKYWPFLFILCAWLVFSAPFFISKKIPFPSTYLVSFFPPWSATYGMPVKNNAMPDVITQIYPWKKITVDSWRTGHIPLWNPYSFSGTPHAGNYQSAVFSPINILFFFFTETTAWSLLILLQPLLAGIFMYFFLRSLDRTKVACALGATSFMFCGFQVVWMAYGTLGYAALWLPFICSAMARYMKKINWWSLMGVSFGTCFSLFSGHFQISIYIISSAVLFALFQGFVTKKWKQAVIIFAFVLLGILLAAPQLLVSHDAYLQSVRSASFVKGEIIPWQYIITFFSPDFYGNPVTRNDWYGHYAEWAGYIGVIPLLFALYALYKPKSKMTWFFVILSGISLALALPTPFSDILFRLRIPVLSTSAASRIIIITSFALCTLCAYGADRIRYDWKEKRTRLFTVFACLIFSGLAIFWLFLLFGHAFPADKLEIAIRNSLLPTFFVISGVALLRLGFSRKNLTVSIVLTVLLLISATDSLRFARKWIPYDPVEFMYPKVNVLSFLQSKLNNARVFGNYGNEMSAIFGIHSIEGYDALYQRRYGEFVSYASFGKVNTPERSVVLLGKKGVHAQRALDLLGVRYILHRISDGRNVWAYPFWEHPQYVSVYKDNEYEVMENTSALDKYFLASEYEVITGDEKILDRVFDEQFNPAKTVLLETKPTIDPSDGEASIEVETYSATEITFNTSSAVPKLLYAADTYDSGWKATVDGEATTLYRANFDFRAIPVPPGIHTVRMYYEPQSVTIGIRIALLGLLILAGGTYKTLYDHRHI